MGGLKFLPIFLTSILFLFTSSVRSRSQQKESPPQQPYNISSFSLKLSSGHSLYKFQFKNLKGMTLARLERDVARVNFLNEKINRAIQGNGTSDLKSMDLETPIAHAGGGYFVRLGFGTPAREMDITIDTGSDVTWIQCAPCVNCPQTDPIFDPAMSHTYEPLACDSQQCNQLQDEKFGCSSTNTCVYKVRYGDGSFTKGDLVKETLSFGVSNIAIGCGLENVGMFDVSGLLGLGRGSLSFPSQTNNPSFSYCLVEEDSPSSTLEFGSVSTPYDVTAPLLRNNIVNTFYYVGLTGISVGGQMLPIPPSAFEIDQRGKGGVIVDSGTTLSQFQSQVYNLFRDEFVKRTQGLPPARQFDRTFDTCYDVSSRPTGVPSIAFHFGAESLDLPTKNYWFKAEKNLFCLAFTATTKPISVIGNVQQQGIRVSFDVGNSLIGFSLDKCSAAN